MNDIIDGDLIRAVDQSSAMFGYIGVVMEVDKENSPEAPSWCRVIIPKKSCPGQHVAHAHAD